MIAEYYYDPFGRRLWKEVTGVRTYFHYSDEGLVGEYDGTGAEIKTYGYKPGSTWTTDPLFIKENNQYYFYHNDHLGTPQKITEMNGAVVWSAKYESFGEATVDPSSTITNNLRFPGQYYDAESGLHYSYNRYYDPGIGRFLRVDPIRSMRATNHHYAYVENNPIVTIDPEGLQSGDNIPPELIGHIPVEILTMIVEYTVGTLTGAACAGEYCNMKQIPTNKLMGPYSRCLSIFNEYNLVAGVRYTDEFVEECSEVCWEFTHRKVFREICDICKDDE